MNADHFNNEIQLRILKILDCCEKEHTQRELAEKLGVSLGKINYCITELAKQGFIQIRRYKNASKKSAYAYPLTTKGMEEKFRLLVHFLSRKLREYEILKKEIAELNQELTKGNGVRLDNL